MSSINAIQLSEKYNWVDKRLYEKYYGYALSCENVDEFIEAGFLGEQSSWIDFALEKMCNPTIPPLCPTSPCWIMDPQFNRKRAESDISDYEEEIDRIMSGFHRLSPISKGKYDESFELDSEWSLETNWLSEEYDDDATVWTH